MLHGRGPWCLEDRDTLTNVAVLVSARLLPENHGLVREMRPFFKSLERVLHWQMVLHPETLVWVLSAILDPHWLKHLSYLRLRRRSRNNVAIGKVDNPLDLDVRLIIKRTNRL